QVFRSRSQCHEIESHRHSALPMQHVHVAIAGVPAALSKIDQAAQRKGRFHLAASGELDLRVEGLSLETTSDVDSRAASRQPLAELTGTTKAGFEGLILCHHLSFSVGDGDGARYRQAA